MNDFNHRSATFDVPLSSDRDEKWQPENGCFSHNEQFSTNRVNESGRGKCAKHETVCDFCSHSDKKSDGLAQLAESISKKQERQKSGDWKYDDEWTEVPLESANVETKCRNPYSISDFDRSNYWNAAYFASENQRKGSEESGKTNLLHKFREHLANYQESYGVPRTDYSFTALIKIMGHVTGRSLLALFYTIMNILPVFEIFLCTLRFILDKVISIQKSSDFRQAIIQYAILYLQLFSVCVSLTFIFGFIVLPVLNIVINIIARLVLYD